MGLSNGYLGTQLKRNSDLGESAIVKIIDNCLDLNPQWLIMGKGQMLIDQENDIPKENQDYVNLIPLLPVSAQGGSFNDFVISVKNSDCEKIISPIKGADFAITVAGDSMTPEYPNGSILLIKKIDEKAFIEWGKVYVLDTCNGTVVKQIEPGDYDGELTCVSLNPSYKPFKVPMTEEVLYGMYKVLMCMSLK